MMRYRLERDDDGHWYIIPADKLKAFIDWCGSEDYFDDVVPEWANAINSGPSRVTFTNPVLE